MSSLSHRALREFRDGVRDELSKDAGVLGSAGALAGLGLAGGALAGGTVKGVQGYREAREQGAGVGGSLLSGLGSAVGGAQKGALVGGLTGAGVGAAAGALRPELLEQMRQGLTAMKGPIGGAARFGQRQVHALTGWKPGATPESLRSIGAGAHNAETALRGAVDKANLAHAGGVSGRPMERAMSGVESAKKGYGAAYRAEQQGLTSIPGYARSVRDRGLLPTMSAGFKEQWHSMSPGWKAVMIGAPVAETAAALRSPEQEGGPGRGETIARGLAGATIGATMGAIPLATSNLVLNPAVSGAAGLIGRGVDRLRGRQPKKPDHYIPAETTGQVTPLERHLSDSAAGRPLEVAE